MIEKLSKEVVLYLSKIASPNLIELVGVILIWLKLGKMEPFWVPLKVPSFPLFLFFFSLFRFEEIHTDTSDFSIQGRGKGWG